MLSWLPVILTGVGLVANLVWTVVNLRVDARLGQKIDGLKEYMDEHYIRRRECDERHGETFRRLASLGA